MADGNVRGSIILLGSPVCNYLKFAGELEAVKETRRVSWICN